MCFHVLCIVPPIPASPFLLPLFCLAGVCPEHPPSSSRLQTSCHIFLSLTYLPTYLPLVFDFSFFLGEFVIPACAFLCTSMDHPQSTREHPQSALDFRPLSHLSLSLTYLPVFLVFALFLMRKFVLQACAFWLVGWCTSMFHKYIHKKTCLWNFFFSVSFLLRDFESFFFCFLEAQTIDPTWHAFGSPPRQQAHWQRAGRSFTCRPLGLNQCCVCKCQ